MERKHPAVVRRGATTQWKLGDAVETALSAVGITEEKVVEFLGRPCGCKRRKEKLNQLSAWAQRKLQGLFTDAEAEKHLNEILDQPE